MFSSSGFSGANTYRQVGVHGGVVNASPHMLIQMLFDGLFQCLNAARGAMEREDIEEKGRQISKAVRILEEGLVMALDMEKGGELAGNLRLLYHYAVKQLTTANLNNDVTNVEEVVSLLQPVAQGWKEIGPQAEVAARGG